MDEQISSLPTKPNPLLIPAAIVIAGAIIGGGLLIGLKSNSNAVATSAPAQQQAAAQTADITKVKTAGEPTYGNANAPVTIAYWYDYQCPFCKQNEETAMPQLVKEYVDTGKVKIVFKDYQFLGQDSQTLGQFSRAVWAVAPTTFYKWHKFVYDNQGTENTGWATAAKIRAITIGVLGASDEAKVEQLVKTNGSAYQKEMDADKAEGTDFGVSGTPGFIIGKQRIDGAVPYAQIKAAIDTALAGK